MGLGIEIGDWELGLGIENGDWDWGLRLEIGIGIEEWGLGTGNRD